jgi:hypothetical protein
MSNFCELQELACHNARRALHVQDPAQVELVDITNTLSQPYAEKLASTNTFAHSGNTYKGQWLGENLYMMSGGKLKGGEACAMWYDEIKYYDFTTGNVKAGSPAGAMIGECFIKLSVMTNRAN